MTLDDLKAGQSALLAARYSGTRSVTGCGASIMSRANATTGSGR